MQPCANKWPARVQCRKPGLLSRMVRPLDHGQELVLCLDCREMYRGWGWTVTPVGRAVLRLVV